MRLHGWADAEVLALLSLFRKYLVHYVYTSDNAFVEVVRAELAGYVGWRWDVLPILSRRCVLNGIIN